MNADGKLARTSREPERRDDAFVGDRPDETAVKAAKAFSQRREIVGDDCVDRTRTCTERVMSQRPQPPLGRGIRLAPNHRAVRGNADTHSSILLGASVRLRWLHSATVPIGTRSRAG